jgi:hypothetical protein
MTNASSSDKEPQDAINWAQLGSTLKVSYVPSGALNLNVDGRQLVGPLQGFGQMWQKTYRIPLIGVSLSAATVIKTWKENFPRYWPLGNHFYGSLTGIAPGEIALLNLSLSGGMMLSTGVLILYADEESFTLMTPQGHMFAGWITFSAFEENGCIVAQTQVLMRANDPLYEIGLRFGGQQQEDAFWQYTLKSFATEFGVDEPVQIKTVCVDPRLQWFQAKNIWQNAAIRTLFYGFGAPIRWLLYRFKHCVQDHQR